MNPPVPPLYDSTRFPAQVGVFQTLVFGFPKRDSKNDTKRMGKHLGWTFIHIRHAPQRVLSMQSSLGRIKPMATPWFSRIWLANLAYEYHRVVARPTPILYSPPSRRYVRGNNLRAVSCKQYPAPTVEPNPTRLVIHPTPIVWLAWRVP